MQYLLTQEELDDLKGRNLGEQALREIREAYAREIMSLKTGQNTFGEQVFTLASLKSAFGRADDAARKVLEQHQTKK